MVGGGGIFPVHLLDLDFVSGETVDNSKSKHNFFFKESVNKPPRKKKMKIKFFKKQLNFKLKSSY